MAGTIRVANLPGKGANGAVYIGRAWRGVTASPFGNPRVVGAYKPGGGRWTAGETLPHYDRELRDALGRDVAEARWGSRLLSGAERQAMRDALNAMYRRLRRGEDVVLDCHCKRREPGAPAPVDGEPPCHGDVLARLLRETLRARASVPC